MHRYLTPVAFQSTRPSRGETSGQDGGRMADKHFNPLAPRGARPVGGRSSRSGGAFQSTRPSRGETGIYTFNENGDEISIHSPLAGRDSARSPAHCHMLHFNPLAPRGARRPARALTARNWLFQSTRPSRGETSASERKFKLADISIHSPLAGRDAGIPARHIDGAIFQSTRPSRGETAKSNKNAKYMPCLLHT